MGRFFYGIRIVLVNLSWIMINHASWWIPVRQPMRALVRLSGPADNCWNAADVDLNSRRNPLSNFKYESYSKPEEDHFQLRIIWLLSIVSRPLQSGSRSNGEWTATYLGAIDHWIFSDWTL